MNQSQSRFAIHVDKDPPGADPPAPAAATMTTKAATTDAYDMTIAALDQQFAEMTVKDDVRKFKRMDMPFLQLTARFDVLLTDMMNCGKLGERGRNRRMIVRFGTIPMVIAKLLWEFTREEEGCRNEKYLRGEQVPRKAKWWHLLYALNLLREYKALPSSIGAGLKLKLASK